MSLIPHKGCILGFGLQTAKDAPADCEFRFPIHEAEDLNYQKNYSFFQYSDGNYNQVHYYSEGEWIEGAITMPLIPGVTAGNIGTWIWGRTGTYHQGYWATIYRDTGHKRERYVNCKVASGSIPFDYGALSTVSLNVVGIEAPETTGAFGGTRYTAQPYLFNEAGISLATGGGSLGAEVWTRNHTLEFDNMQEAPADMGMLDGDVTPPELPNNAKAEWTGSLDRFFADASIYDDFVAGTEGEYRLIFQRAGVATCTLYFPRILWVEAPLNIPNSGVLKQEGINFRALGSVDGLVDAFALSETIP